MDDGGRTDCAVRGQSLGSASRVELFAGEAPLGDGHGAPRIHDCKPTLTVCLLEPHRIERSLPIQRVLLGPEMHPAERVGEPFELAPVSVPK